MQLNKPRVEKPGMVEVRVEQASELDDVLTTAIEVIKKAAAEHRVGILVTRIDTGRYIVRAHPAVPFGLIRQQHGAVNS